VADLRGHADQVSKDGNQPAAKAVTALADVLEGIAAWKRGRLEEARATLVRHANDTGQAGARARAALADMAMEAGRFDQAIHYAQSLIFSYDRPRGLYIQAKAYEAKGDTAKALDRWRHFVTLTRKGDDDVAQVREGREAVARLGG
jgi:tetratricopeptide (TPR) repeat protein